MAIMPHPERTVACDGLFKSMCQYIADRKFVKREPLKITLPIFTVKPYHQPVSSQSFFVKLIITDNHAETVKTALKRLGIDADVKRYIHWEVTTPPDVIYEAVTDELIKSGELFNIRKETYYPVLPDKADLNLLVRDVDDMRGQQKLQLLTEHFHVSGLEAIKYGVVWQVKLNQPVDSEKMKKIETILFNPHAHEVYSL